MSPTFVSAPISSTEYGVRAPGVSPNIAVLHHGATTSLEAILALFQPGGRVVSAHRAIKDATIVATVPETHRAYSLADAYWDSRAFTVECANESTTGWTISDASHESLAWQVADWAKRYGFWPHRSGDPKTWTVLGHREVYTIHGGSYATACPGGMDLNRITARAQQLLNATMKEIAMAIHLDRLVKFVNGAPQFTGITRVSSDVTGKFVDLNESTDATKLGQLKYYFEHGDISAGGYDQYVGPVLVALAPAATVDQAALDAAVSKAVGALKIPTKEEIATEVIRQQKLPGN